jgi:hypothetical protein
VIQIGTAEAFPGIGTANVGVGHAIGARDRRGVEGITVKSDLRTNQDFLAGLLFCAIGLTAAGIAWRQYPIGTSATMGPGYFPVMMGGILTMFGIYILVRGLFRVIAIEGAWAIRPLVMISISILAFGFLMDQLGMIVALLALFLLSAFGGHEFRLKEVLILTAVMTLIAWAVFIYGLGVSFRLFTWGS